MRGVISLDNTQKLKTVDQCSTETRPPGSGARPPRPPRPGGLGAPPETFPHAPKNEKLQETQEGARLLALSDAPLVGGSHTPPPEDGGLPHAPHDFAFFIFLNFEFFAMWLLIMKQDLKLNN